MIIGLIFVMIGVSLMVMLCYDIFFLLVVVYMFVFGVGFGMVM